METTRPILDIHGRIVGFAQFLNEYNNFFLNGEDMFLNGVTSQVDGREKRLLSYSIRLVPAEEKAEPLGLITSVENVGDGVEIRGTLTESGREVVKKMNWS